jgi:hypothetical protein
LFCVIGTVDLFVVDTNAASFVSLWYIITEVLTDRRNASISVRLHTKKLVFRGWLTFLAPKLTSHLLVKVIILSHTE